MKISAKAKFNLEQSLYRVADKYYVGYKGGSWAFSRSSIWSPKVSGTVNLVNPDNYSDITVSPKVAGYCLTLLAASRAGNIAYSQGNNIAADFWFRFVEAVRNEALDLLKPADKSLFLEFID